ncbi:MAG: Smr/MutS family protein [Bacteroidia bacterium]
MKFNIGDEVSFLNEKGKGVVCAVLNKKMVSVRVEDGFEFPYAISELVLLKAAVVIPPEPIVEKPVIDVSKLLQKKNHPERPKRSKPHSHGMQELEVNLHIEELMDNYSGMSNAEIVRVQLRHFTQALDKAISGHYKKLVVIHGVGNGRLKQEVRSILDAENIRYHDASYARYGFGATEVIIS